MPAPPAEMVSLIDSRTKRQVPSISDVNAVQTTLAALRNAASGKDLERGDGCRMLQYNLVESAN
jgi:hypothetical protein